MKCTGHDFLSVILPLGRWLSGASSASISERVRPMVPIRVPAAGPMQASAHGSPRHTGGEGAPIKSTEIEEYKCVTHASSSCMLRRPVQQHLRYADSIFSNCQINASGSRAPEAPRRGTKVWGLPKCKMSSDEQH